MHRLVRSALGVVVVWSLLVGQALAANLGVTVQQVDASQFPTVRVYASVADSQGVPITGLDSSAFVLQEDGKAIETFKVESVVDSQEPVAVALAFDESGSMADAGKLDGAKKAADAFVDAMGPNDTAAILGFTDQVAILQGYTGDHAKLKAAIDSLKAQGNTSIYDAVVQAATLQGAVPTQRKIILLLTDGDDNHSKANLDGAVGAANKAAVPIFAIGVGSDVVKANLDKLASSTSGQSIYTTDPAKLSDIFQSIGDQLRREYVLTYTSKLAADAQPHTVSLKASYRGLEATAPGSFSVTAKPIKLQVSGIADASKVSGTLNITANVTSGTAQQVQLLVDGAAVGSATQAPYSFTWDTSKVSAGLHTVIVQATDAAGQNTQQKFVVDTSAAAAPSPTTVAPTATSVPNPTAPPAAVPTAAPTIAPTAAPTPAESGGTNPLLIGGAVVGLLLVGGIAVGVYTLANRSKTPAPPPPAPVVAPPPRPQLGDQTEAVGRGDSGATLVASGLDAAPAASRGRLRIVQGGSESEVVLDGPEAIMGREASNPIVVRDAMASRRHAKITREGGEFWIEDLKSLNGTLVNGEPLTGRRRLAANDQITIGDVVMTFLPDKK
jgi:VWFA-related protein